MVKLLIRVSDFTYLGSVISETGGTNEGITARIRKTQTVFSMLMPVWKLFLSDWEQNPGFSIRMWSPYFCTARKHNEIADLYQQVFPEKILKIRWPEVTSDEERWERTWQSRIDETSREENGSGMGIRSGSQRTILSSNVTLRGPGEGAIQGSPGGAAC